MRSRFNFIFIEHLKAVVLTEQLFSEIWIQTHTQWAEGDGDEGKLPKKVTKGGPDTLKGNPILLYSTPNSRDGVGNGQAPNARQLACQSDDYFTMFLISEKNWCPYQLLLL